MGLSIKGVTKRRLASSSSNHRRDLIFPNVHQYFFFLLNSIKTVHYSKELCQHTGYDEHAHVNDVSGRFLTVF